MDFAASVAMRVPDREWASGLVDQFPRTWQAKIITKWRKDHRAEREAGNLQLLRRVRTLSDAGRGGIAPDAGDAEICKQADMTANDFERRIRLVRNVLERGARYASMRLRYGLRAVGLYIADYCRALLDARGLVDLWPAGAGVSRDGAVKRLQDARWWRRAYRKLHARTVEACGIGLGLVSRAAGLYASDEAVKRRRSQNARNAAALESVTAVNDHGQDYTLAELAATGTANKTIRRVELLTRIAGFELIAKECGHIAYMVTVTAPSRFHRMTTRDGRVLENKNWRGATPDETQRYLAKQWGRCRAAFARAGLEVYGFRIAEPQHDGTPHWHCLLFMPHGKSGTAYRRLVSLVRRYFWRNDSPNEAGAKKHRCDFERIDWRKGSAVGYVIKYISKNIDGHGVGIDLFGNDAITSSQRVEAWASTWRIRQFQQIGGAPVTVWRELRRLHPDNAGDKSPDTLTAALSAVNVAKLEPGVASIAWRRYNMAQGGIGTKRKNLRMRLLKEQTGELGRYGEVGAARAIGVVVDGLVHFKNHVHVLVPHTPLFTRKSTATVESERAAWFVMPGQRAEVIAAAMRVFLRSGEAAQPRIHVNNCTQARPTMEAGFTPIREHRPKFRRWAPRSADGRPPSSPGD